MRELERDREEPAPADSSPALRRLAVIGNGRVGGSVASAARAAGFDVSALGHGQSFGQAVTAQVILLCVPDRAIPQVSGKLAQALASADIGESASAVLTYVGHVSGASGLDALEAVQGRGTATFTLHPLQTIPHPGSDLTGVPCAVSGATPAATEVARHVADRLGMRPFELADEARAAYHAAAVIAANFLVALEETAADLLERAGVADARSILAPLVLTSAANWSEVGGAALTGPIARGDETTVARHLEALRRLAPEMVPMYEAMAQRTRVVAATNESGSHQTVATSPTSPPTEAAEVRQ